MLSQSDREWLASHLIIPADKTAEEQSDAAWLEDSLSKFHADWGGNGSPMEIAEDLRRGVVNSRTVEAW